MDAGKGLDGQLCEDAVSKEVDTLIRSLEANGWRVQQTKKGWLMFPPNDLLPPIVTHRTPSDGRAIKNLRADIRRAERQMEDT